MLKGKVTVITGGALGMGREIALNMAGRGSHVAICDVNETDMAETIRLINEKCTVETLSHKADVSNYDELAAFAAKVGNKWGKVDYLYNNAGFCIVGRFEKLDFARIDKLINVNLTGVLGSFHAFFGLLNKSDGAHICNTASIAGIFGLPYSATYSATKFGVKGFSEALINECKASGYKIKVSTAYPGGVNTNIPNVIRDEFATYADKEQSTEFDEKMTETKKAFLDASTAAEIIVSGTLQGKKTIKVGKDAKQVFITRKLLGNAGTYKLMEKLGFIQNIL